MLDTRCNCIKEQYEAYLQVKYSPASAVEEGALAGLAVAEALADPAVVAFRLADSLEAGPAPADSLEAADPRDPDIARNKKRG